MPSTFELYMDIYVYYAYGFTNSTEKREFISEKERNKYYPIYEEYKNNQDDVVILGVAFPNMGREGTEEDIKVFLVNNNCSDISTYYQINGNPKDNKMTFKDRIFN